MNNLTINPKTGEYGTKINMESGRHLRVTREFVPQFSINNEYTGMMVFGKFKSKDWYRTHMR